MNLHCHQASRATLLFLLLAAPASHAQSYSIDWHKIAGGGGTSTNQTYLLSGTIGQHDASAPATNAQFTVTGGFWSRIVVIQTAGLPPLRIVLNGANGVTLCWPNTGAYTLQHNPDLTMPANWTDSNFTVVTTDGTNYVSISPAAGTLFFRLKQ